MKKRFLSFLLALCMVMVLLPEITPSALAVGNTFTDVSADHWAYHDIEGMAVRKVVNGLGDGRFNPNGKVTGADFSVMVARLFFANELSKHLDQPKDYWWQPYADTLMELGAYNFTDIGFSYNKNGKKWVADVVEAPLNRYVMAGIMDNVLEIKKAIFPSLEEETKAREEIADLSSFPIIYRDAVVRMYTMGCLKGMDSAGNFLGEEQMNRAQACVVLTRMVDKLENQSSDDVPDLSLEMWESEVTLEVGTAYAEGGGLPRGTKVVSVSSNPTVVKTSGGNGIQAVSPGVAQVTYTASFWHKSAQKTVTVTVVGKAGPGSDLQTLQENMLALINRERTKEGREPLVLDNELCQVAQTRAKELIQSYSHTRPDGRSCDTALVEAGVSYHITGENIAAGQTSEVTVMGDWMNSTGHRANILDDRYGRVGIGYAFANDNYGTYWVQIFAD